MACPGSARDLWETNGFPNPRQGNFCPTFKGTSSLQPFPLTAVIDTPYFVKDIKLISSVSVISEDGAHVCDTDSSWDLHPTSEAPFGARTASRHFFTDLLPTADPDTRPSGTRKRRPGPPPHPASCAPALAPRTCPDSLRPAAKRPRGIRATFFPSSKPRGNQGGPAPPPRSARCRGAVLAGPRICGAPLSSRAAHAKHSPARPLRAAPTPPSTIPSCALTQLKHMVKCSRSLSR